MFRPTPFAGLNRGRLALDCARPLSRWSLRDYEQMWVDFCRALLLGTDYRGRPWRYYEPGTAPADYTSVKPPRASEELIYMSAVLIALAEASGEWRMAVSGKRGRPRSVSAYLPDGDVSPYTGLSFRRCLTHELGWDKQLRDWTWAKPQSRAASLETLHGPVAADGLDSSDGDTKGWEELIDDPHSMVGANPALLVAAELPQLELAFELFRRWQGWFPGCPPRLPPKTTRWDRSRDGIRGAPEFVAGVNIKPVKWTKANPKMRAPQLEQIRRDLKTAMRGAYHEDGRPARLTRSDLHRRELDELRKQRRPRNANQSATIATKGAACPMCDAFFASRDAIKYHDCIQYLETRGVKLSELAINQFRAVVRAENEPVLAKLEELKTLVGGRPVAEAEAILRASVEHETLTES